jgi:hypothetical protein
MLVELSLGDLFEWYEHFTDMYEPAEQQPTIASKASTTCTSVNEEIAMMRAMMGG